MEITFWNRTEDLMETWTKKVSEKPSALVLTDELHPRGLSRLQVDELSGRLYGWLKEKQIGGGDSVLICLPRGSLALISMLGVWKAGAAFAIDEYNSPPERSAIIKKDLRLRLVIDLGAWEEILKTEPLSGFERADLRDAAFAPHTEFLESDRLALITPLSFDASIRQFINVLHDGPRLFVVPLSIVKNPARLRQYLEDKRITVLCAPPSMLRAVGDTCAHVRQIEISGEPADGIFMKSTDTEERTAALGDGRTAGGAPEDTAVTEMRERGKAHPLTPNQISIFDYCIYSAHTVMWNLPRLYRFDAAMDAERLCRAVNEALANRPALYTVLEFDEECDLVQRIAPEKMPVVQVEEISEAEFQELSESLVRPFRMIGEPLIHVHLMKTEKAVYLFFDVHHIMTDGSGMQLLNEDIVRAWKGEPLPLDTYYASLYHEENRRAGKKYQEDRAYLENAYGRDDWCINLIPDVSARPAGRVFFPLKETVSPEAMKDFEKKQHTSRNLLFTAVSLLGICAIEKKNKILVDWIFHDRTDEIRKNAFGCLFRYITVGLEVKEDMTLAEFFKALSGSSNRSLFRSSYEWSLKRDNVFEHDMMIVCYETSEIMSTSSIGSIGGTRLSVEMHAPVNSRSLAFQIIEGPDQIVPYMMFNQAIYSEEKIMRAEKVFSGLLHTLMTAEPSDRIGTLL